MLGVGGIHNALVTYSLYFCLCISVFVQLYFVRVSLHLFCICVFVNLVFVFLGRWNWKGGERFGCLRVESGGHIAPSRALFGASFCRSRF